MPSRSTLALWAHALSLDSVLAVVAAGWLVARALDVRLPSLWWPVLGLTCFLAYLIDHLGDARRLDQHASPRRRLFIASRRRWSWFVAGLTLVDLLLASLLPALYWKVGLGICALVIAHLGAAQRWERMPKELSASAAYLVALWAVPLTLAWPIAGRSWLVLAAIHGLAAFANLSAISAIDVDRDRSDGQRSLATRFGAEVAAGLSALAGGAALFLAIAMALSGGAGAGVALALAAAACAPASLLRAGRAHPDLARAAADLAFVAAALLFAGVAT